MTVAHTRSALCSPASDDDQAVKQARIKEHIIRRYAGKVAGQELGWLYR